MQDLKPPRARVALVPDVADAGEEASRPVERLLTAKELAHMLNVAVPRVYELAIPRIQLSPRSFRWALSDVTSFLAERRRGAA